MKNYIFRLADVNLSIFSVLLDKNEVFIEVLNMEDGKEICTISFVNIISFRYNNNIKENEVLPAYIGELNISIDLETGIHHLEIQGWIDIYLSSIYCTVNKFN